MSFLNLTAIVQRLLNVHETVMKECVRNASKKAKTSTQNVHTTVRPKHRGWKRQDGHVVEKGTILATQRTLRFHPGLNVGFGKNATLYALEKGRVVVTCEKIDPRMTLGWVNRTYSGREEQVIYKKYFNIITEPMHTRFKLIDQI